MRDTTIAVTKGERKAIDLAAKELFESDDVPYGFTIVQLIRRCIDIDLSDLNDD